MICSAANTLTLWGGFGERAVGTNFFIGVGEEDAKRVIL